MFAIAVLGPLMLALFSHALTAHAQALHLPAAVISELRLESAKLGLAQPPAGLDASTTVAVAAAIKAAFVDSFRWIVAIAGALCGVGALVAWRMLPPGRTVRSGPADGPAP